MTAPHRQSSFERAMTGYIRARSPYRTPEEQAAWATFMEGALDLARTAIPMGGKKLRPVDDAQFDLEREAEAQGVSAGELLETPARGI